MKRLILLTVAICLAESSFSQTDFRKGYIITNARDTLFGLVDYRDRFKSYKSCDFKESKDPNTINYEPNEIVGYGFVNDKFFESKEISISGEMPKIVFLEVIVGGLVTLYKFEDIYFIEKNANGLQQLTNESQEVYIDGKRGLKYTNKHISTINMLLFDCAELRHRIQKIKLSERPLTGLVEDYNKCKGLPGIIYKARKPWAKSRVGISTGINISQINFEDAINGGVYEHLEGSFEVSKSPAIGISLDFSSPRLNERISFHSDILYLVSQYYAFSLFDNISTTKRNYVTIEMQQLKIPIGLRYTFPKRNFTPYFNIGISSTIHLSSNSKWVQEVEFNSVVDTYYNEALTFNKNQLGLWGGLGILKTINNNLDAFIELRYEQSDGISQNSIGPQLDLKYKITNFQIIIGISTN